MNKILLIIGLALVSHNAVAEWVMIDYADSGSNHISFYVEDSRIKASGNKRQGWMLASFSEAKFIASEGYMYFSSISKYEYDCFNETERLLFLSHHSLKMGGGDTLYSQSINDEEHHQIMLGSVADAFMKYSCDVK